MTMRILIVDDERALLSAMSDYLGGRGYACECAGDVAEAIALLANARFDVVITDIYLSAMQTDGFEVLSFIRDNAIQSRVIVMTAHDSPEVVREAERLSADLFIAKPVPMTQLDDALTGLLGHNA